MQRTGRGKKRRRRWLTAVGLLWGLLLLSLIHI